MTDKSGKRPADNDNPEGIITAELQNDTGEVTSKEGARPADNDNPMKEGIDDTEESKIVTEQKEPTVELSEDIKSLLESIDLDGEFKEKALTIFEASVAGQVSDLYKKMMDENQTAMEQYKATLEENVNKKVDLYLEQAVEKWVEENQVAIKSNLRTQIAESFMANVASLLESHYITVPDSKEDILEQSLDKITKLEETISELLQKNKDLQESGLKAEKASVFESVIGSLTDTQKERVKTLAESIKDDVDVETYKSKLTTIVESLVKEPVKSSQFVTEDIEGNVSDKKEDLTESKEEEIKYPEIKELASRLIL